jgi:hypothetical protein
VNSFTVHFQGEYSYRVTKTLWGRVVGESAHKLVTCTDIGNYNEEHEKFSSLGKVMTLSTQSFWTLLKKIFCFFVMVLVLSFAGPLLAYPVPFCRVHVGQENVPARVDSILKNENVTTAKISAQSGPIDVLATLELTEDLVSHPNMTGEITVNLGSKEIYSSLSHFNSFNNDGYHTISTIIEELPDVYPEIKVQCYWFSESFFNMTQKSENTLFSWTLERFGILEYGEMRIHRLSNFEKDKPSPTFYFNEAAQSVTGSFQWFGLADNFIVYFNHPKLGPLEFLSNFKSGLAPGTTYSFKLLTQGQHYNPIGTIQFTVIR